MLRVQKRIFVEVNSVMSQLYIAANLLNVNFVFIAVLLEFIR